MAVLSYLQVSRICNQTCLFCASPDNGRVLSLEKAREHVDKQIEEGSEGIIITGGEPTLYEPLPDLIAYGRERGISMRITTNGQLTSNLEYLKTLMEAGLSHMHLSMHSHIRKVQTYLSGNPESLENVIKTLYWADKLNLNTNINMTTCKYNSDHVHKTIEWVCTRFPFITHISWTNLDPFMNRVAKNPHVVPKYSELEDSLMAAMQFLDRTGRTFRMEKVPLCYMLEFAHCSTETRRIVKGEIYFAHYLDHRAFIKQEKWFYHKTETCEKCSLNSICAGLWEMGTYYDPSELRAQDADPQPIIDRILSG